MAIKGKMVVRGLDGYTKSFQDGYWCGIYGNQYDEEELEDMEYYPDFSIEQYSNWLDNDCELGDDGYVLDEYYDGRHYKGMGGGRWSGTYQWKLGYVSFLKDNGLIEDFRFTEGNSRLWIKF